MVVVGKSKKGFKMAAGSGVGRVVGVGWGSKQWLTVVVDGSVGRVIGRRRLEWSKVVVLGGNGGR